MGYFNRLLASLAEFVGKFLRFGQLTYRLMDPGSEWRLHREWYDKSAMGDLLHEDFALAAKDNLYRCLD